jgi:hypothetical protein
MVNGFSNRIGVDGDNRVDVLGMAAAHGHGDGQSALAAGVEYAAIALA